jgi:UDP-glucuronate 4-epimerase
VKVLVTGSLGFLGLHIVHDLQKRGFDVVGVDRIKGAVSEKGERRELTQCRTVETDLSDLDCVLSLFKKEKPEIVIHLAGQYSVPYNIDNLRRYVSGNLDAFCWILEACKLFKVRRLLYASSIAAGTASRMYGITKAFNELAAKAYAHQGCFEAIGLRYAAVYGPQQRRDSSLYRAASDLLAGRSLKLGSDYSGRKEWIEVSDAARVTVDLVTAEMSSPHEVCLVAAQDAKADLGDALRAVARAAGVKERYPAGYEVRPRGREVDLPVLRRLKVAVPATKLDDGMGPFVDWLRKGQA